MEPHLFIHVQHLLGIGHMERALAVASACLDCGFTVTVATGRRSCEEGPAVRWVPLPDLRSADASFSQLLDEAGAPVTKDFWAQRRDALLGGFRQARPSLLLVEGFPFARRRFRHELLPLLAQARRDGVPALCSVRDILQPKTAQNRLSEILGWANTLFDLILVHGDPAVARLADSYAAADRLETPVVHTGYVSKRNGRDDGETGRGEVVVSAGGGAVGAQLFAIALAAAALPGAERWHWRLLVGRNMAADRAARTDQPLPGHVTVEPARPDFRALLSRAAVSVSQSGYNTAVDLFASGAPAVLVPFAAGGQKEQTIRAERMAAMLGASVLPESGLTPPALLAAVEAQARRGRHAAAVDLNGAERTARLLSLCQTKGPAAAVGKGLEAADNPGERTAP